MDAVKQGLEIYTVVLFYPLKILPYLLFKYPNTTFAAYLIFLASHFMGKAVVLYKL